MKHFQKIVLIVIGLGALVLIRAFETELFYDPLLNFFKTDHTTMALPSMEKPKVLLHVIYRFILNTTVSVAMLWVVFRNREVVTFSLVLYGISGVILGSVFWITLHVSEPGEHMALFYVRRFLIQPLLLFLLIPAFYVQKIQKKGY